MCGIAGIVSIDGQKSDHQARLEMVQRMTEALIHRGPNDGGVWQDQFATLGHRRLSIIDLTSSGRQPMSTADDSDLHIVFNGEIYNFNEIRQSLEGYGYRFRTRTDTEVLLRSYQQWGVDCTNRLRGMFAFAIWDARRRRLLLARDRLGKKPLFYTEVNGTISFASEIQGLLRDSTISRRVDYSSIDQYLSYGYIPSPHSGFKDIFKLPPAHRGVWEAGKPALIERYWSLTLEPKSMMTEDEAVERLQQKLAEAVRIRMVGDVPVGAFLSGGIDSSIVVGLMASQSDRPVKTFSIGFKDENFNELQHARRVADRWKTDHQELIVEPDALQILPSLIRHLGEPLADASIIPTWYLSLMTSREVTVALTGDGGDESFAGYERYLANYFAELVHQIPFGRSLCRIINQSIDLYISDPHEDHPRLGQLKRFLEQSSRTMIDRYPRWLTYFTKEEKRSLYLDGYFPPQSDYLGCLVGQLGGMDPVEVAMVVDLQSYLPEDLLVKVDIATMASGLEARSPFLDHELVELAASLPVGLRMKRRQPKYLLKKAFAHLLPKENLTRDKMGFGVPIGEWFRGPLREMVEGVLLDTPLHVFRRDVVERYLKDHLAGTRNHSFQLWNLLILELWLKSIPK
jgi:asparagine synthase (glutamine-hydrolysing)